MWKSLEWFLKFVVAFFSENTSYFWEKQFSFLLKGATFKCRCRSRKRHITSQVQKRQAKRGSHWSLTKQLYFSHFYWNYWVIAHNAHWEKNAQIYLIPKGLQKIVLQLWGQINVYSFIIGTFQKRWSFQIGTFWSIYLYPELYDSVTYWCR